MSLMPLVFIPLILLVLYPAQEAGGNIIDKYNLWIDLFDSDLLVQYELWIVHEIDSDYCYLADDMDLAGCATISNINRIVQVEESSVDMIDPAGHDIFLHEYLHARCEHLLLVWHNIHYNWHVDNKIAMYDLNENYWETCGYD